MATTCDREYLEFEPSGKLYSFSLDVLPPSSAPKRPRDSQVNIPCHVGVVHRGEDGKEPEHNDGRLFFRVPVFDPDTHKDKLYFCRLDVLCSRVQERAEREADFEALKKGEKPFRVWTQEGKFASSYPQVIVLAPALAQSFDSWDEQQRQRWRDLATKVSREPPLDINQWGETKARFKDLPRNEAFRICFTPNHPVLHSIDLAALRTIVDDTFGPGVYDTMDFRAAEAEELRHIGHHPFGLFHTWTTSADYVRLCKYDTLAKKLPPLDNGTLLRPFPDDKDETKKLFDSVNKDLGLTDKRDASDKAAPISVSFQKVAASHYAVRSEYGSQNAAYNNKGAPSVAKKIWPDKPSFPAEWLHRSAFAFGGIFNRPSLRSSQTRSNLVFGSSNCNTHMIRAENAIVHALAAIGKNLAADKWSDTFGILTTTNVRTGTLDRLRSDGTVDRANIPTWVDNKKYIWLCLGLKYEWVTPRISETMNLSLSSDVMFDPWSRYCPLMIEAKLDTAVMKHIVSNRPGPSTLSTSEPPTITPTARPSTTPTARLSTTPAMVSDRARSFQRAIHENRPYFAPDGVVVKHPKFAKRPQSSTVSSRQSTLVRGVGVARRDRPGQVHEVENILASHQADPQFVVEGEISVFGISTLKGIYETWVGPPPSNVSVENVTPLVEKVTLVEDLHISLVIPELKGTVFDFITFTNVVFFHQTFPFDKTKAVGWHVTADWVIDASCGSLYELLTGLLQVKEPTINLHAGLGLQQSWSEPLSLHSLMLEGVLPGFKLTLSEHIHFASLGVRLLGIRGFTLSPKPYSTLRFGFGVFGTMFLDVPRSVYPLHLNYEIGIVDRSVQLTAHVVGNTWNSPLGIQGLQLSNVTFAAAIAFGNQKAISIDVYATFGYKQTHATFHGSYTLGGAFILTASLPNFSINAVRDIYEAMNVDILPLPPLDVTIESATISISSIDGMKISLDKISVADYTSVSAELVLSSTQVSISGQLNRAVKFKPDEAVEVEVKNAVLRVDLASTFGGKSANILIGGRLTVAGIELDVAVHLYPETGKSRVKKPSKHFDWTIVAALATRDEVLALSKIVPGVKNTFLDLKLKEVFLVVASKDNPSLVIDSVSSYKLHRGIQFCATIGQIPVLNDLMQGACVDGLTLSVGYSDLAGFSLEVLLPTAGFLKFGNGIQSTAIRLMIETAPIGLAVSAGLSVPAPGSPDPLEFILTLHATVTNASATGEMQGYWYNPFGLQHVKVGPRLALLIEIIYAQFAATGTPSGFGVSGQIEIGDSVAQLTFKVSEDPRNQLLEGVVKEMNATDVVAFVNKFVDTIIPSPPRDFLDFKDVEIYICPAGVQFGVKKYPQGFSFIAKMILFGKCANIECTVNKERREIVFDGGVDDFEVGPLKVHGITGPRATLSCVLGKNTQHVLVDGVVEIFNAQAKALVEIQLLPSPVVLIQIDLKFFNLVHYQLHAELVGDVDFTNLKDGDFTFDSDLQQHVLECIREQVLEQFEGANLAATVGIDTAKEAVEKAKREMQAGINRAEKDAATAHRTYQKFAENIHRDSDRVIQWFQAEVSGLQSVVDKARVDYNNAMEAAQRDVRQANINRAVAMAAAERDVTNAKRDMSGGIDHAQRHLDYVVADLDRAFGDARLAIRTARRDVQGIQNDINNLWHTVHDYEDAPWYEFWKKAAIAGLMTAIGALEASKAVADTALRVAEGLLHAPEFLAKEAAITSARAALEAARQVGYAGLDTANAAVRAADITSQKAVDLANESLKGVQMGVDYLALQRAIDALETFKNANSSAYKEAVNAIKGIADCAEYTAYHLALRALEIARGATDAVDVALATLETLKKASRFALDLAKEIARWGTRALDIRLIHISGSVRGILGVEGSTSQPLHAVIRGYIFGRWFDIQCEFDPHKVTAFIESIFKQIWSSLEKTYTTQSPRALAVEADMSRGMASVEHHFSEHNKHAVSSTILGPRLTLVMPTHMRPMTVPTHSLAARIELSRANREVQYRDLSSAIIMNLPQNPDENILKDKLIASADLTPPGVSHAPAVGSFGMDGSTFLPRGPFSGKTFAALSDLPVAHEVLAVHGSNRFKDEHVDISSIM